MHAVTVGLPIYNNAATLRRAVESALAQTVSPAHILISDDASSDGSQAIGEALARAHPTVSYIRQPRNLGAGGNFRFVAQAAATPFFHWLAGDDLLMPDFVEKTRACLLADPALVGCVSRVRFVDAQGRSCIASGGEPLEEGVLRNLARYLERPGANARLYSLFRTEALQRALPPCHFHAFDWAIVAGTLLQGGFAELPETLMVREHTPTQAYIRQVRRDNKAGLDRLFPLLPLTRDLLWRQRVPLDWPIARSLLKINLEQHGLYAQAYHPRYARWIASPLRRQLWRLEARALQPAVRRRRARS